MRVTMSTLKSRCIFPVVAMLSLLGFTSAAQAAGFIKFDGVDGESLDQGHKKWSDIESFSQSVIRVPGKPQASINLGDIQVEMPIDAATDYLYDAAARGARFPVVIIDLCEVDSQSQAMECYLQYKLKNVLVTSYKTQASSEGVASVGMSYDSAERDYLGRAGR